MSSVLLVERLPVMASWLHMHRSAALLTCSSRERSGMEVRPQWRSCANRFVIIVSQVFDLKRFVLQGIRTRRLASFPRRPPGNMSLPLQSDRVSLSSRVECWTIVHIALGDILTVGSPTSFVGRYQIVKIARNLAMLQLSWNGVILFLAPGSYELMLQRRY